MGHTTFKVRRLLFFVSKLLMGLHEEMVHFKTADGKQQVDVCRIYSASVRASSSLCKFKQALFFSMKK